MRRITPALAALAALVAAGAPARAAEPAPQPLNLANESGKLVYCAVLVDGRLFVNVRLKPGARWSHAFDPRRDLKLVCNRLKKQAYGPLAPGSYSFFDGGDRVDLRAAEGA